MPKTEEEKEIAEQEIRDKQRPVDYDTKEYPVETIVDKYLKGIEDDTNELFIPDYQRDMAWDAPRMSKFIESLLVGLPIPYIFVADISSEGEEKEGRLEIVDGSQRIRTLAKFMRDEFALEKLEKLEKLNGFLYSDLPLPRQRRFNRRTLRMIELTEQATEEVRRDLFERINTGSVDLNDMEKRRGIRQGPMLDLIEECAAIPKFHTLAPLSETAVRHHEPKEFVLRFFAYLDSYKNFDRRVNEFLNEYLDAKNKSNPDKVKMKSEFTSMLDFVEKYFPNGFKKKIGHIRTPRIRFEALAVGTALALRDAPNLVPPSTTEWLDSAEFKELTTSDSSNSRPKVIKRIEYVRDKLLGNGPSA